MENDQPTAEPEPRHDFSVVQGFQVVDAEDQRLARAGDETWREALRLELEARAARLHQAVDAAIMLSNDGIIRWLGDPVAKLSVGPNVLSPSAVIFADESLPDASRETVKTRNRALDCGDDATSPGAAVRARGHSRGIGDRS